MSPQPASRADQLLAKAKLTVGEMTELIAVRVAALPSVRKVSVADLGEVAVELIGGQRIEVQAIPVARDFNQSIAARREALARLMQSCA